MGIKKKLKKFLCVEPEPTEEDMAIIDKQYMQSVVDQLYSQLELSNYMTGTTCYAAYTTATTILQQQAAQQQHFQVPFTYEDQKPIDEQILSIQDERDSKDVQIELHQLECTCGYTTLIKTEYSPQDPMGDMIKFPCPACENMLTLDIPNASPDGASYKIIEVWKTKTKITVNK